jgi:hypothetical protein
VGNSKGTTAKFKGDEDSPNEQQSNQEPQRDIYSLTFADGEGTAAKSLITPIG